MLDLHWTSIEQGQACPCKEDEDLIGVQAMSVTYNFLKFFDLWFNLRLLEKVFLTYTGQVWRTRGSWSHYKIFFVDEDFWWKTRSSASGKTPLTQPDTSTTLDSCSSTCSRRCLRCKGEAVEAEAVVHTAAAYVNHSRDLLSTYLDLGARQEH